MENALAYQEIVGLNDHLAEEKEYLEAEIRLDHDFGGIIGESSSLKGVLRAVETVAPTAATVLIRGETGTGKEMLARAIHNLSPRRDRTFVRLNLAALPASLIESELFGYERGAFTGATTSKIGRLELANRGTLFLDEAGDIPAEIQPKLLRALQEKEFERLGSTRTQQVDVRLIAATNRDLEQMIADGLFRSDLYYRLNVFPITGAGVARTAGRHSRARPPFRRQIFAAAQAPHHDHSKRHDGRAEAIVLAGQHSRAGEPDRACGHSFVRPGAQGSARRSQACVDTRARHTADACPATARGRAPADPHRAEGIRRRDCGRRRARRPGSESSGRRCSPECRSWELPARRSSVLWKLDRRGRA